MRRTNCLVTISLVLILTACALPQMPEVTQTLDGSEDSLSPTSIYRNLTGTDFRQDLTYLQKQLPKLDKSMTSEAVELFNARIDSLITRANTLSYSEFAMEVQRAVAVADNAHTHTFANLTVLPIGLQWFADGLYIITATSEHADLLGARLLLIGTMTPDALLTRLDDYIGGTKEWVRVVSIYYLRSPEALKGIGAIDDDARVQLTLVLPDGRQIRRILEALPPDYESEEGNIVPLLHDRERLPLYLWYPEVNTFWEWVPELDALYIQINTNRYTSLVRYLDRVLAVARNSRPRHAIVDLRFNSGGNYTYTTEFAKGLPDAIAQDGKIFIITGNHTFSAGIATAALLKYYAADRAIIVGDYIGDRLQFWAGGGILTLPKSGLRVVYAHIYHDWERCQGGVKDFGLLYKDCVPAGRLAPHIQVKMHFAD